MTRSRGLPTATAVATAVLCGAIAVHAEEVDRETRSVPCGLRQIQTCVEVREFIAQGNGQGTFSITNFVVDSKWRASRIRQRLLVATRASDKPSPSGKAFFAPPSTQFGYVVFWLTPGVDGAAGNHGPVNDGGNSMVWGQWAGEIRQRALAAEREGRALVDSQRREVDRSASLAKDWASAMIGRNAEAISSVMTQMAAIRSSSEVAAEIELENTIRSSAPAYLMPPAVRLEGAAVRRHVDLVKAGVARGRYRQAVESLRVLRDASLPPGTAKASLAPYLRPDGRIDLSRARPDLARSPLGYGSLGPAQASVDPGIRWEADAYEAMWAESGGLQALGDVDRLEYVVGADMIRLASAAASIGDYTRRDGLLSGADALLQGVRGFTEGMIDGLVATAELVPELALALPSLANFLTASPDAQIATLSRILASLPKVKEYVMLSLARLHDQWVSGGEYERSRLLGRAMFEIGTFLATGEIAAYLKVAGEAGEVAKLSRVRKELADALHAIDRGGAYGNPFSRATSEAIAYSLPKEAVGPLVELTTSKPDTAAGLLSLRFAMERGGIKNFDALWADAVISWGPRDADVAAALQGVIGAGTKRAYTVIDKHPAAIGRPIRRNP